MTDPQEPFEDRLRSGLTARADAVTVTPATEALRRQKAGIPLTVVPGDRTDVDRSKRRVVIAAAAAVLLVGAALVAIAVRERRDGPAPVSPPSTVAHPFVVDDPPAGYTLVRADLGQGEPTSFSDQRAADEPFTLLTPSGRPDDDDRVAVSFVARTTSGMQIDTQHRGTVESSTADGQQVDYSSGDQWADLVWQRRADGDTPGLAVRVSSSTPRTRDELLAIARTVPVPTAWAPVDPPKVPGHVDGLRVAGSTTSYPFVASRPWDTLRSPSTPARARVALFVSDDGNHRVVVRTLPGTAGDLDVLGRRPWLPPRRTGETTIDGRRAIHLAAENDEVTVVSTTSAGDLLLVSSTDLDVAELDRVAGSVRVVDEAAWTAEAATARGGPGLRPTPGSTELDRGEANGIGWLLQTKALGPYSVGDDGLGGWTDGGGRVSKFGIDPCLRLVDGLSCGAGGTIGLAGSGDIPNEILSFRVPDTADLSAVTLVVVTGREPGTAIRITPTDPGTPAQTVDLQPTPKGDGRYAVVPVGFEMAACGQVPAEVDFVTARVTLVDASGAEVACLGFGS
jgi:hypothetical protein